MRSACCIGPVLLATLVVTGRLPGQGLTRIDFENLPAGTRVDVQYLALGVRFLGFPVIDTLPAPLTGKHVLVASGLVNPQMATSVGARGTLVLSFLRPQAAAELWVSGQTRIQNGTMQGVVEAYDPNGRVLARDGPRPIDPNAPFTRFFISLPNAQVSGLRIAVVDSTGDGRQPVLAAIDDLGFGATPWRAVPDLGKRPLTVVKGVLADSGFQMGTVSGVSKDTSKRWIVAGQSIPPGERRPPGAIVNVGVIAVAPPPFPAPQYPIPNLINSSVARAATILAKFGFRLGNILGAPQDSLKFAIVLDQSIAPGTRRPLGTAVDVRARVVPPPPPRPRWWMALFAAALVGVAAGAWALRNLRWRVRTGVDAGLDSLHPRLTTSEPADWQLRLVVKADAGVQQMKKEP